MPKLSELAAKARRDPFEFDPEDGQGAVVIEQPTWDAWHKAGVGLRDSGDVLEFLQGLGVPKKDAKRVDDAIGKAPVGTGDLFTEELRAAFGLGN